MRIGRLLCRVLGKAFFPFPVLYISLEGDADCEFLVLAAMSRRWALRGI